MDPEVCLAMAQDKSLFDSTRALAARELRGWLERGGFVPAPYAERERIWLHAYLDELINKLEGQ